MPQEIFPGIKVMSVAEILALDDTPKGHWGHWHWKRSTNELVYRKDRKTWYYIDIDRAESSPAELLDWIFQAYQKTWMSPQDAFDMLKALDEIIQPQRTLCSWGIDQSQLPDRQKPTWKTSRGSD